MQRSLRVCARVVSAMASIALMTPRADAQVAADPPPFVPIIIPRLIGTPMQTMGGGDIGAGKIRHDRCKAVPDCQVKVRVRLHPHDEDNRACLVNVHPVVYVHRNVKHTTMTWILDAAVGSPEFRFVPGRGVEISDNIDDDDESPTVKKQVFEIFSSTDKMIVYKIMGRPRKAFAYTINIDYPDPKDASKPIPCTPLDPIIVNRD